MVNDKQLSWVRKWFELYTGEFCTGNERIDSAICLKVRHTNNVEREIVQLTDSLSMSREERYLAQICAILHDIGRFEQYARYHTFSDLRSENHAAIGLRVIEKFGVLRGFFSEDEDLISSVVLNHNRAYLPKSDNSRFIHFLKLVRDADKLDILHMMTDYYEGAHVSEVVCVGLPDQPAISKEILKSIVTGEIGRTEHMKTRNDFKLLQISWIFDFNFAWSFSVIDSKRYIDRIGSVLPQTESVTAALNSAHKFLKERCGEERR
ncbi:MAG: HD domain-containing protein [Chitinispirillaceae bacterium]